jgi:predicted nucleotidyltransferase
MTPDFLALLRALEGADVEYVVVGGVAAILAGAPMTTLDLDVVYKLGDSNLQRFSALLEELDTLYRDPAGRKIRPTVERLRRNRVNLLQTRLGLLDALQEIGSGWSYEDLLPRTQRLDLDGVEVPVLKLAAVIESKQAAGRDKDLAQLPLLRRTHELQGED